MVIFKELFEEKREKWRCITKLSDKHWHTVKLFSGMPVEMLFREKEGWTVIIAESVAKEIQLKYEFVCRKITLNVHSSLDAVGFIAAVASRLTERASCGVNPVSGYYHDHLFVPVDRVDDAMKVLQGMTET